MPDPRAHEEQTPVPEPTGIVSVNSRGGAATGMAGKLAFILLVVGLVLVGSLIGVNKYRANRKASEAAGQSAGAAENRPASVAVHRIFNTDPPALPGGAPALPGVGAGDGAGAAPAAAAGGASAACPDHGASQPLLGADGKPMNAPSGLPIRVCGNGQVAMQVVPAVQALPGEGGGGPGDSPARVGPPAGTPPVSRYGGDVVVPSLAAAPALDPNNPLIQALLGHTGQETGPAEQAGAPGSVQNAITGAAPAAPLPALPGPSPHGPVASLLHGSEAAVASATRIGNRNMILPQGRSVDCNLSVRLINEVSGKATCVLSSNVYSDNGRVVLAERGSVAIGEYVALAVQGQRRLFVLWTRLQTPTGVVVTIDSPAADALGTTGLGGYVDNRWSERIGAAVLLSLVDDAIGYQTAKAAAGDGGGAAQGIAVFQNTTQTGRSLSERILDSTINIKPTIYKNQGDRATIFVTRDLDFGSVYALRSK